MKFTISNMHLHSPYIASLQAIALICCFVALFFSCEEEPPKSSEKKIDQLVLTVGGTDTPVTFGADYNAALTVPFGTDLTAITVKTLVVSAKATVSVAQGDVLTVTSGSATLTVTAEDGSKQIYTVSFTVTPPRTGAELTALTATISGQAYSSTGANPAVVITNNNIAITIPVGSTLPVSLLLTGLTLSPGASSVPAQGATLSLTAGAGTLTVTAEDGMVMGVYTVQVMIALNTGAAITALTATISGQSYSSMGANPAVVITSNTISLMVTTEITPFGSLLPANITLLTLSPGASSTFSEGDALDLTATGVGSIIVQAEDPTVAAVTYTITVSIINTAEFMVTTYTNTDTLGIAVRDVVEAGRSVSFSAMDTVIMVSGLADVSVDWALGTLRGTKAATAGTLVLTQSDLGMFPAMADATYALTVSANAQTSDEKDLFYYPGQLRTWRDLQAVRVDLAGTYRLMNDISFPDEDGDGVSEYNFEPLGRDIDTNTEDFQGDVFSGTFDGAGHVVNNLYINRSTESHVGLFGRLTGTVRNVGLVAGTVMGRGFVGGFAGSTSESMIFDVYVTGTVTGSSNSVGGLVGHSFGGMLQGAYTTGSVTGNGTRVGGLVGANNRGIIQVAYATGAVTGDSFVGGLVGSNAGDGTIQGAYATGAVMGEGNNVGGLVGNSNGMVRGVYATGAVTGNDHSVGGLVGGNGGTIEGAYATGAVTGSSTVGGLAGFSFGPSSMLVGYARGNVTRTEGATASSFGRLVGLQSGTVMGYYSGAAGESQLLSAGAMGANPTPLTGTTGVDGTARTSASVQADFTGFDFTTNEIGQWIYTAGRWPALNLGGLQSAAEQPTQ